MASALCEEQFQCCICLEIFKRPVSIPCGHNFCLECIQGYWDTREIAECPLCKETFRRRPTLKVNTGFADITDNFRRSLERQQSEDSSGGGGGGGDVPPIPQRRFSRAHSGTAATAGPPDAEVSCDVCPRDAKAKAVRSCLVCQASYCQSHLTPHQREAALQQHRLTDPATFPSQGLCRKHRKPLDMFCRNDLSPLCVACCTETDHQGHDTVRMHRDSAKMKAQLKKTEAEVKRLVQLRLRKKEEVKHSLEMSRQGVENEIAGSVEVFSELMSLIERRQAEVIEEMEEKQREAERRAEALLRELDQEITELQRRSGELEQLEHTEDHLHLLQSLTSLSIPPSNKDWSETSVHACFCVGTARRAISKMVDICREMEKKLSVEELKSIQQYAVDVTLDPVTAASWLILSPDGKQVNLGYKQNRIAAPDDPRRFDSCVCVLGKEGYSSGRCYFVVQVGDKTDWDVGMARESVNRKGSIKVNPGSGFWAICRRKAGCLSACTGPSVALPLRDPPQKVGVFLDYEGGTVAFYDAEAKAHLYSYRGCAFTEALYPYFNPCLHDNGKNVAPLIICPVETMAGGTGRATAGITPAGHFGPDQVEADVPPPRATTLPRMPPPVPPRTRQASLRPMSHEF